MTPVLKRPATALAFVVSAASTGACGLVWSFDGYAGNPSSDGGFDSGHQNRPESGLDGSRVPEAGHEASSKHDAGVDAARDATVAHDAGSDAAGPRDGGHDVGSTPHDACADGGCSPCDGMCQPVTLNAGPAYGVSAIAIDQTKVYWTSLYGSAIGSVSKDGGVSSPLTISAPYMTSIVVGGGVAYFGSADGFIASCPTTGCVEGTYRRLVNDDGGDIQGVASVGPYLFGIDEHLHGGAAAVLRAIVDGGAFDAAPTTSGAFLDSIVATDASVFWSTVAGVYSCTPASCSAGLVASVQQVGALAVDGMGNVYWLTGEGDLMTCTHAHVVAGNCDSSLIALTSSPIAGAARLAVDDSDVYVSTSDTFGDGGTSHGNGTIVRCSQKGCPTGPTMLAKNENSPGPIAVDGTFVYWADTQNGPNTAGSTCPIRALRKQ